jgi:ribosomal protein L33
LELFHFQAPKEEQYITRRNKNKNLEKLAILQASNTKI